MRWDLPLSTINHVDGRLETIRECPVTWNSNPENLSYPPASSGYPLSKRYYVHTRYVCISRRHWWSAYVSFRAFPVVSRTKSESKPSWILVATRTLMKIFQKLFPRKNLVLSNSGVMHPFLKSEIFKTVFCSHFPTVSEVLNCFQKFNYERFSKKFSNRIKSTIIKLV